MSDPPPRMAGWSVRRAVVLSAAAAWIVFLAGLAWWTANPVTLNRSQLLLARATGAVVIAEVLDAAAGQLKVEEVLQASEGLPVQLNPSQQVTATSLTESGVKNHDRIVAPLIAKSGEANVAIAPTPTGTLLTYPATPEVVAEVKQLISQR